MICLVSLASSVIESGHVAHRKTPRDTWARSRQAQFQSTVPQILVINKAVRTPPRVQVAEFGAVVGRKTPKQKVP